MTENPDPEDLARLYMEFWRKNMAGLTRDPQVAEGIARLFDLMTAGASTFSGMMAAQQQGAGGQAKGAARAKTRAKAEDAEIEARFDQLTRRVAELERRIARLEPRARVRRAPARPRRPRR